MQVSSYQRRRAPVAIVGGLLAVGIAGGIVALVVAAARKRGGMRALVESWFGRRPVQRRPVRGPGSFAALRDALVGTSKQSVSEVFGPPPTASLMGAAATATPGYWEANVWYYPLDLRERSGMAILFDNGRAAKIDLIRMPRGRRGF